MLPNAAAAGQRRHVCAAMIAQRLKALRADPALAASPVLGLLLAFQALHLQTVATGWDSAEYVWAIDADLLPHSPYVGYVLLGELASRLLPTALACSLLSALAALATAAMLARSAARVSSAAPRTAAGVAAGVFAFAPVCLFQGCIQEVYALQLCGLVASARQASRARPGRAFAAGALFGGAIAVHSGSLLVSPAVLWLVWSAAPSDRWRRLGLWCAGVTLTASLLFCGLWYMARRPGLGPFVHYLRGIAPAPGLPSLDGLRALFGGLLSADALGGAGVASLGAALVGVWLTRHQHKLGLVLALWAAGFVLYEVALGFNVDPGVYLVYVLPPLALLVAQAAVGLVQRTGRLGGCGVLAALALYALYGWLTVAPRLPPDLAARFKTEPLVRASLALRDTLPPDAVVVQAAGVRNVNLLPSLHLRRPIILQDGRFWLMQPYHAGQPINQGSFVPLTRPGLRALLAQGRVVVLYDGALLQRSPGLHAQPLVLPSLPEVPLLRLITADPGLSAAR